MGRYWWWSDTKERQNRWEIGRCSLCLLGFIYELNVYDVVKDAFGRDVDIGVKNDKAVAHINEILKTKDQYARVPVEPYFEEMGIVRGEE